MVPVMYLRMQRVNLSFFATYAAHRIYELLFNFLVFTGFATRPILFGFLSSLVKMKEKLFIFKLSILNYKYYYVHYIWNSNNNIIISNIIYQSQF